MITDRIVVTWEGKKQPIVLAAYGADEKMTVPLSPSRAFELARDLLQTAISASRAGSND